VKQRSVRIGSENPAQKVGNFQKPKKKNNSIKPKKQNKTKKRSGCFKTLFNAVQYNAKPELLSS
jgi:hypothetical protein